jgi:membrane protein implicated in regulation of membrane protease activity
MSRIDWPLAVTLAVVFVVMSIVRWRYFMRRLARRKHPTTDATGTTKGTQD